MPKQVKQYGQIFILDEREFAGVNELRQTIETNPEVSFDDLHDFGYSDQDIIEAMH